MSAEGPSGRPDSTPQARGLVPDQETTRIAQRLQAALESARTLPEFERVYTGPIWPAPVSGVEATAWKVSVLRRVPGAGAEHWGHLFLLAAPESVGPEVTVRSVAALGGSSTLTTLPLGRGGHDPVVTLWMRPTSARTEKLLFRFGEALRRDLGLEPSSNARGRGP